MSISIGDLARTVALTRQTSGLKVELDRSLIELTTGTTSDISKAVKGDFTSLAAIDRSITMYSAYDYSSTEAARLASAQQDALDDLHVMLQSRGTQLAAAASVGMDSSVKAILSETRSDFDMALSRLNTTTGGRAAFAGADTQGAVMVSADEILTSLRTAIGLAATAEDVMAEVDAWFDAPGGGFETDGYLGSADALSPIRLDDNRSVSLDTTALDSALRDTLKGFAVGSLVQDGLLESNDAEQSKLAKIAGEEMIGAQDGLVALRASIGTSQAKIESATVRNAVQLSALTQARSEIVGVDQYEAANRLSAVQAQLETLYTVTARLSQLSLAKALG
ncbi:flagellin [Qingshengfaniella alkalisoli]|uniref:Flagellin C-terminal domain-containing protein n=1 Tax=Qingshengfaniella alkalisoli TaxID=2599296 RepID=A0A5B8J6K2_9RHOB|nr:flagellin [Qingshengfaniella alkalisoli]QDY70067.1 hypothetical protein FPZ52_10855 [Qingshengfaniella alkalisoli]